MISPEGQWRRSLIEVKRKYKIKKKQSLNSVDNFLCPLKGHYKY